MNNMIDTSRTYTLGEFSKLTGHGKSTLQLWDRKGVLVAHRTLTNRRYYTHNQYLQVLGEQPHIENDKTDKRTVIYARVSSRNQEDNLVRQKEFLQQWANARGIIVDKILTDIGSGLNFKRRNFNKLMYSNDISRIIIAHKDRLTRFGFDWFEDYLKRRGVELIVVNNEELSPQTELVDDLIAIIHMFSRRVCGLRKYAKKVRDDTSLQG